MFVDASAMIAMLTEEPDANVYFQALDHAQAPITSAIAIFEATLGFSRKLNQSVAQSELVIRRFLADARVRIVSITDEIGRAALVAHTVYGKGRSHPAKLNMGDCFAYAVAKSHGVPLLFKGNDFPHTDITPAS